MLRGVPRGGGALGGFAGGEELGEVEGPQVLGPGLHRGLRCPGTPCRHLCPLTACNAPLSPLSNTRHIQGSDQKHLPTNSII